MHFKENKEEYKKKGIFILLILFTAFLQNTGGLFPKIYHSSAMLLIPLTVCIAMFESDMGGMMFGLFAGLVWDFYSAHLDGYYAVVLCVTGYICSFLLARYMRNNVITAFVFVIFFSFLTASLYFVLFVLTTGIEGAQILYVKIYLPSVLYTVLLTPLYYWFVRMIALNHKRKIQQAE